jgi:RNA polymerase sigma factor (sigma-70 family)
MIYFLFNNLCNENLLWYTYRETMQSQEGEFLKAINEHRGILYKISRMYSDTFEDEKDLEQEIVLQLWQSYKSFNGQSKFSSWMYRVALNTALVFLKKKKRRVETTDLNEAKTKAESPIQERDRLEVFYAACKSLSKVERALVFLYMEGISHKEIAKNLNISPVNARVKLTRTKHKLQEIIKQNKV